MSTTDCNFNFSNKDTLYLQLRKNMMKIKRNYADMVHTFRKHELYNPNTHPYTAIIFKILLKVL